MEENELLTEEQISEIAKAVGNVTPEANVCNLTITEEGRVRVYEVEEEKKLDSADIQKLGLQCLMNFEYNLQAISLATIAYIQENFSDFKDFKSKLARLDFSNILERDQYRLGENLKKDLIDTVQYSLSTNNLVEKVRKEMEFQINRCLSGKIELHLSDFEKDMNLSFILRKAEFDPNKVGVYKLGSSKELYQMVKDLSEVGELAKLATHPEFKDIAKSFMADLKRTDIEDLEQLVKTFTDTYVNHMVDQKLFVDTYLYNIVTGYGYTFINGYYVVDKQP